ncbi:cytochrome P450 [Phanerochaete sordida]|uniref:Cytochrome P450 n=1 Tax=Phanerochaete sordida TaxID=48140 RepID=A0A9P3LMV7_9APHY|nr:cytochrome P450 [Phanerochaete sordida]
MAIDAWTVVLYLTAVAFVLALRARIVKRRSLPHPPGPRGWPIVGHLKPPEEPAYKEYLQWSKQYGSDVVRLNMGGSNIIVTNTLQASSDLLEKRSQNYSNRAARGVTMLRDLCGFDWSIAFAQPDEFWRDQRKFFQREYGARAIKRFRPAETQHARAFLRNLLETPLDFFHHARYVLGKDLIYSAYGLKTGSHDDPLIETVEHGLEATLAAMIPGRFLVDAFPILKYIPAWFPGADFQREAGIWRASIYKMVHEPFVLSKKISETTGLPDDCAAKTYLTDIIPASADPAYMEHVALSALAASYVAGTDTTVSTLQSFFLAMTLYPDVQKRAQREIDEVCQGRLPEFSDHDALPYVHALMKELLRWHPAVPLNMVHASTQDDAYNGYFIPRDSLVIANICPSALTASYPAPRILRPSRTPTRRGALGGASARACTLRTKCSGSPSCRCSPRSTSCAPRASAGRRSCHLGSITTDSSNCRNPSPVSFARGQPSTRGSYWTLWSSSKMASIGTAALSLYAR